MSPLPPSPRHRSRTRWLSVAAASLIGGFLAGCAELQTDYQQAAARYDQAGYELPQGSLAGINAIVTVVPRKELQALGRHSGLAEMQRGEINALARWLGTPGSGSCFITLAADAAGYAALEHELWHCKIGAWHN